MMRHHIFTPLFLFIILTAPALLAGNITGTVTDVQTGKPLSGATIEFGANASKIITDHTGKFYLKDVTQGNATLTVKYIGYADRTVTITVPENETAQAVVTLEPKPFMAETVVVTATKSARDDLASAESIDILTSGELADRNAITVTDAMRNIPGVYVKNGPTPDRERIEIRGMEGEQILVAVDGAKMNYVGIQKGAMFLTAEDIERIEIVKGPASALYGSSAMGGVINVITREPRSLLNAGQAFGGRAVLTYNGLNEEAAETFQLYGITGPMDWKAGYTRRDGKYLTTDPNDPDRLDTVGDTAGDTVHFDGIIYTPWNGKLKTRFEYSQYVPVTSPGTIAPDGTTYYRYQKRNINRRLFQAGYTVPLPLRVPATLEIRAYRQDTGVNDENEERSYDTLTAASKRAAEPVDPSTVLSNRVTVSDEDDELTTWGAEGKIVVEFSTNPAFRQVVTAGAELMYDQYHELRTGEELIYEHLGGMVFNENPVTTPVRQTMTPDTDYTAVSGYIQDEMLIGDRWIITPGLRLDGYRFEADLGSEGYTTDGTVKDNDSEIAISPKLGVVYRLNDNHSLTGSAARGFRMPARGELFYSFTMPGMYRIVPNPSLDPESCINLEFGIKSNTGRIHGGTTVFHAVYSDFIAGIMHMPTNQGQLPELRFENLDEVTVTGVESSYEAVITQTLAGGLGFSYHFGGDESTDEDIEGLYRPKIIGSLAYTPSLFGIPFRLRTAVRYCSPVDYYEDGSDGSKVKKEHSEYTVCDIGAGATVAEKYRLNMMIHNVFDTEYREFRNFNLPSPGRYFSVSLTASY